MGGDGPEVQDGNWHLDNTPVQEGSQFQVNTYTSSEQFDATVTSLGSNGFIVTWRSYGQDGSDHGVSAQRYDTSGAPVGDEFQVNTETDHGQQDLVVAMLDDGSFVVTWESRYQDSGSTWGVYSQHFNADGTKASDVKLVGGSGDETLVFDAAQDGLSVDLGDGLDTLTLGSGDDNVAVANTETVKLGDGNDTVIAFGENWAAPDGQDYTFRHG